jgi:hypothetical protein
MLAFEEVVEELELCGREGREDEEAKEERW